MGFRVKTYHIYPVTTVWRNGIQVTDEAMLLVLDVSYTDNSEGSIVRRVSLDNYPNPICKILLGQQQELVKEILHTAKKVARFITGGDSMVESYTVEGIMIEQEARVKGVKVILSYVLEDERGVGITIPMSEDMERRLLSVKGEVLSSSLSDDVVALLKERELISDECTEIKIPDVVVKYAAGLQEWVKRSRLCLE